MIHIVGRSKVGQAAWRFCSSAIQARTTRLRAKQTAPVGSFPRNKFGLYDMVGNVWEWTADCYHDSYDGAPQDGSAWLTQNGGDCNSRPVRGGSWNYTPDYLRSAFRLRIESGTQVFYIGFRVARTPFVSR
jgi:formylglycine-generating enzyme required for sulfatase activity